MDTSKTYIKMCEKAEEIQKVWHETKGDFYARYNTGKSAKPISVRCDVYISVHNKGRRIIYYQGERPRIPIWLPRQDQLQEMLPTPAQEFPNGTEGSEEKQHIIFLLSAPYKMFINNYYPEKYLDNFTSMEQLWLAFVMLKCFGKKWDGMNWE